MALIIYIKFLNLEGKGVSGQPNVYSLTFLFVCIFSSEKGLGVGKADWEERAAMVVRPSGELLYSVMCTSRHMFMMKTGISLAMELKLESGYC